MVQRHRRTRRLLTGSTLLFASLIALGAGALAHAHGALAPGGGMGPHHMTSQTSFLGYYDSHKVTYLSTDTSSKAQAAAMHINYAPALASVKGSPAIYLVKSGGVGNQLAVFGSQPGDPSYSPLWEETTVKFKAGAKPVLLTSDNQILALAKKGTLTVTDTHVVLNCPVIKVG